MAKLPGWTLEQVRTASKMWIEGDLVGDISRTIHKDAQTIYGYARDHRESFPKRTRGARKKKPPFDPIPAERFPDRPISDPGLLTYTTIKKARASFLHNSRLAKTARKNGRPMESARYERAAFLCATEIEVLKKRDLAPKLLKLEKP